MRELAFSPPTYHVHGGLRHPERSSRVGPSGDVADNGLRPELRRTHLVGGGVDPICIRAETQGGQEGRSHLELGRARMLQVMAQLMDQGCGEMRCRGRHTQLDYSPIRVVTSAVRQVPFGLQLNGANAALVGRKGRYEVLENRLRKHYEVLWRALGHRERGCRTSRCDHSEEQSDSSHVPDIVEHRSRWRAKRFAEAAGS